MKMYELPKDRQLKAFAAECDKEYDRLEIKYTDSTDILAQYLGFLYDQAASLINVDEPYQVPAGINVGLSAKTGRVTAGDAKGRKREGRRKGRKAKKATETLADDDGGAPQAASAPRGDARVPSGTKLTQAQVDAIAARMKS